MAPLTTEPDHLRVVLNLARRKAFYSLVSDITSYLRSQLQLERPPEDTSSPASSSPSQSVRDLRSYSQTNAPSASPKDGSSGKPPQGGLSQPPRQPKYLPPSPALVKLRRAALMHFDSWCTETLSKLREVVSKADDQATIDARRKRSEVLAARSREVAAEGKDLLLGLGGPASDAGAKKKVETAQGGTVGSLSSFQNLYHPIPTRLTTVPAAVVVVVFDGVGGLHSSPRPEPPMGHMAVLG